MLWMIYGKVDVGVWSFFFFFVAWLNHSFCRLLVIFLGPNFIRNNARFRWAIFGDRGNNEVWSEMGGWWGNRTRLSESALKIDKKNKIFKIFESYQFFLKNIKSHKHAMEKFWHLKSNSKATWKTSQKK